MEKQTKKSKKKQSNLLRNILLLICLVGIIYCGYNIYLVWKDYHTSDVEYDTLINDYVEEVPIEEEEYTLLDINWDELKKINPDIVGWIRIKDTVVNYPIVRGANNDIYIHKTFEGKTASAGAIFMDYRNEADFSDYVTVLYGHNMKNKSMFSMLRQYLDKEFLEEHKYIEIYTPNWTKIYEPSYVYTAHYTNGAYDFGIADEANYKSWLSDRNKSSKYKKDPDTSKNSIVLSTCYGKSGTENRCIVVIQETEDSVYGLNN